MKKRIIVLVISLLYFATNQHVYAQTNDDCFSCHDDKTLVSARGGKTISMYVTPTEFLKSGHKTLTCIKCHTDAAKNDFEHASGEQRLKKVTCFDCHGLQAEQLKTDIHKTLNIGAKAPDCYSCHKVHNSPLLATSKNLNKQICGQCHKNDVYKPKYHVSLISNTTCTDCHDKKNYQSLLQSSVHPKLNCSNCHGYVVNNLKKHETDSIYVQADCYLCHSDIAEEHKQSIHGISIAEGINEAAHCWDCHGSHTIYKAKSDSSLVHPKNIVTTCGKCHDNPEFTKKYHSSVKEPGGLYNKSVHGLALYNNNKNAASCADCHGIHNIKNRIQEKSTISAVNLAETCKKCHQKETDEYYNSVHWFGVKKGIQFAPTCNSCHAEHNILSVTGKDKKQAIRELQEQTCLQCHQNMLLTSRYSKDSTLQVNYQDNYHGLAVMRGDKSAAMCVDCHNVHSILPKSHPNSSINSANVLATCKRCHTNASEVFSKSYLHVTPKDSQAGIIERIVTEIYIWLNIIVIGGMFLHNLIIFINDVRKKRASSAKMIKIPRFTKNELIQHYILYISFIILAVTGFMLKFPETSWVKLMSWFGITETARQITHRAAAVVMMVLSVYHLVYLLGTKRGRDVLFSLFPKFIDLKHASDNILYNLRLRKKHPEFNNHNYIEKAEYWALIWGTAVMGLTGLVLWFPTVVGNWAPTWFIKVSEIVHYYEAILASLAILVWHWFFVIFRPTEYPVSFTCVDGKMTVHHYKDEHKLQFKKIIDEWLLVKAGTKQLTDCSQFTQFFAKALQKSGADFNTVMQHEIENDTDLTAYVNTKQNN